MADQVRVQNVTFDFTSCELRINNELISGWTDAKWDEGREHKLAYGSGKHHAPRGANRGKYNPEPLSITVFKDTAYYIRSMLAALSDSGTDFGSPQVPIVLQYLEASANHKVEFFLAQYSKGSSTESEEGDSSKEELEFFYQYLKQDGLTLFDNSQGIY